MSLRMHLLAIASVLGVAHGAVHEKLAAVPSGWTLASAVPTSNQTTTTFSIALHRDFTTLQSHLLSVSTPGSPDYGKYLDNDAVDALFPPTAGAASAVTLWLEGMGVSDYKVDGSFVDFSATLEVANSIMNASYEYYSNDGVTKLRTLQYSIPSDLQKHVAFVEPGTFFGQPHQATIVAPAKKRRGMSSISSREAVNASCADGISPVCMKQLYYVGDYTPDPAAGSRIGYGSFLNQSALYSDLEIYEEYFGIPSQNLSKVLIADGIDDQDPSNGNYGEANLDSQTMIGLAHPLPVTEFITGGSPPFIPFPGETAADNSNEPYVPFLRYLLSKNNSELPQVLSISYGDSEDGVPYDYAVLTCNLIGMMGLRGISMLSSSGDSGLGGGCTAPDGTTLEFGKLFPATCPYITAVGGTSLASIPEAAWNLSGGGFSGYFSRPWYQETTVTQYLDDYVSSETYQYYGQYANFSGRAWPDISAHSLYPYFDIVYGGEMSGSGGTSASSPVVAAIVGLLNDARLRAGKSVLGFLNPLLYSSEATPGFVDVTEGYSYGCRTTIPGARWNATEGWDPTTGFGTPNFQELKKVVLAL